MSDTATITINIADTVAPTQTPTILSIADDTGTAGDWTTTDISPTISGSLDNPLLPGEKVQVQIDGGTWGDASIVSTDGKNWIYGPGDLTGGTHTVNVRIVDQSGNVGIQTDSQAIVIDTSNQAPIAAINSGTLGALVGVGALGLANIGSQALVAYDPNNNITEVVVKFDPVASLGVNHLIWSASIAQELGLNINIVNNDLLGNTLDSTLTITKTSGGIISNESINEFLRTVHLEGALGVSLGSTFSIKVTDANLVSVTDSTTSLANLGLLNVGTGDPTVIQGTNSGEQVLGSSADENLYGFDGDDLLYGGDGNDLLRGGAGIDQLFGETGDDVLIYDALDTLIDGGIGFDTVLVESGTSSFSLGNLRNIEQILVKSPQAVTATLTAADVKAATDANNQLIISGGSNVQLNLDDAVFNGQVLYNGHAYEQYTMGTTTVLVEDPIVITVI